MKKNDTEILKAFLNIDKRSENLIKKLYQEKGIWVNDEKVKSVKNQLYYNPFIQRIPNFTIFDEKSKSKYPWFCKYVYTKSGLYFKEPSFDYLLRASIDKGYDMRSAIKFSSRFNILISRLSKVSMIPRKQIGGPILYKEVENVYSDWIDKNASAILSEENSNSLVTLNSNDEYCVSQIPHSVKNFGALEHPSYFLYPSEWLVLPNGMGYRNSEDGMGGCGPAAAKCAFAMLCFNDYDKETLEKNRIDSNFGTKLNEYVKSIIDNSNSDMVIGVCRVPSRYRSDYQSAIVRQINDFKRSMINEGYVFAQTKNGHTRVFNDFFLLSDRNNVVRVISMDSLDGQFHSEDMNLEEFLYGGTLFYFKRFNYNPWVNLVRR